MSNILIAYFSREGENYWNGSIRHLKKGNTEKAAEFIQQAVGGDLFKIETQNAYSENYTKCTEEAKAELQTEARPDLKEYLPSIEPYDTIFIGYPNWWGTMPMAMLTFLERYDLKGKKLLPFCTNEGSGMGKSEKDLKNLCQDAVLGNGLSIHGAEIDASKEKIKTWAKKSL